MKFLAWFFGIIFLLVTPALVVFFNLHHLFFSPEATKEALISADFYNQARSVIKKTTFSEDMSPEQQAIAKVTAETLSQYDFQPQVESVIDNFYLGLGSKSDNFIITIDLTNLKSQLLQNAKTNGGNQNITASDMEIPDQWKVDLGQYSGPLAFIRFFYQHYLAIIIGYIVLAVLFLLFCLLSGLKYLKLFFAIVLIAGILVFAQEIFWWIFNPNNFFSAITKQGQSGLQIFVTSIYEHYKKIVVPLLLWESIPAIIGSIIGLIVASVVGKNNVSNIPLSGHKSS